jgi:hypothetical protein
MSSNVGLNTPRGSGTSGYVQRNLSHLKPRDRGVGAPYNPDDFQRHKQRNPDPEILEHERRRRIEVKVFELRDRLEEEEYVLDTLGLVQSRIRNRTTANIMLSRVDEDEIDDQCTALRKKLEAEDAAGGNKANARGLKGHQVHDLAKAKIEETEKLRRAFGISKDYEEGSHWRRQDERRKEMEKRELEAAKDEES